MINLFGGSRPLPPRGKNKDDRLGRPELAGPDCPDGGWWIGAGNW